MSPQAHRLLLVTTSVVFALCGTALAQKKIKLDKVQKIDDWGYSIRTLEQWQSIAIKPEQKFTVGHWKLNTDELRLRGLYDEYQAGSYCDLEVIRISRKVVTGKPKSEEELKREEEERKKLRVTPSLIKRFQPKSFDEYLEGTYDGCEKRWVRKPFKAGKLDGELIEFGGGAEAYTIAYFKDSEVEWGLIYTAYEESNRRTYRDWYIKSLETFRLFEPTNTDAMAAAQRDPNKLEGDAKREALKASIAGTPGWYSIDSEHYVFLSNSSNRRFLQKIAKELEVVREKIYTKMFPPRNTKEALSPVRVLDTQSEYHQYGGPGGSAGYFNPRSGELVLFTKFEGVTKTNSLDYCQSVMFHEAFHQYIHYAVGDVSPHSWFNEGHGDFFAGLEVKGSRIKAKEFDWRVDYLKDHIREDRDLIPLRTLIRLPQREYYTNAGLKYSQGWALIYYLREVTKDKREQAILDTYFNYLADNVESFRKKKGKEKDPDSPSDGGVAGIPGIEVYDFEDAKKVEEILEKAVDVAFEGIDLESMDKEFRRWVEKL